MNNTEDQITSETSDLNHVMQARLEKLAQIRELGINPFPYGYDSTHQIVNVLASFDEIMQSEQNLRTTGRLASIRLMGKAAFAHLQDDGIAIQVYFKRNIMGDDAWNLFRLLDIGDIIGVEGRLFITRTGERTIEVAVLTLLSKNIRPLPAIKEKEGEVWNRWTDMEERSRHRPVDLLLNRDSREVFLKRSRVISLMRKFLDERSFIEVETPILQPLYGGAAARPFVTHHHSLDRTLFMRIADELYLKRLIVGGFNRVYEIAKDFRNEGIDRMHSPEFTMLEFYAAYEDYTFCMDLMEQMIPWLTEEITGSLTLEWDGQQIDLTPPYRRATMSDLIRESCGIEIIDRQREELTTEVERLGIKVEPEWGVGKIIDELFSTKIEPTLMDPIFVLDYPVELSPLAKMHRDTPGLVERFELFIGGFETANAFSELNDPQDQRRRFEEQAKLRVEGDEETQPIDEDYIETLELGMPPTAGLGMGVDRLVMLLTGCSSIRDVILFPTLRSKDLQSNKSS